MSERVRVLLICRTALKRDTGWWTHASAPAALGGFSLKRYAELHEDLSARITIDVRSYAIDQPNDLILHEIAEHRADIVGFTCQPWSYLAHIQLSRLIRHVLPSVVVLHGGPIVVNRVRYLERVGPNTASVVVEGEAEDTFVELLRHFVLGDRPLSDIAGIAYYDPAGRICSTADRGEMDLAKLPPLMTGPHLAALGSFVPYETSRGCAHRCRFCNWGGRPTRFRTRRREVIEQDLAAIFAEPRVEELAFVDSAVDTSVDHVLFLADVIRRHRRRPVRVGGFFYFAQEDLSFVEQIRDAFDYVRLGLQVADDGLLASFGRKHLDVDRFERIRRFVLPAFPDHRVDLMFGLPGITAQQLVQSVHYLLERDVRFLRIFRLQTLPGTSFGEHKTDFGVVSDDDNPFFAYECRGTSVDEMLAMQQFKLNMDTLFPLFGSGSYPELRRQGVDAVDFASRLHLYIRRLNHRVEYGFAEDLRYQPDLVQAILDAARQYAEDPAQRAALLGALDRSFGLRRD